MPAAFIIFSVIVPLTDAIEARGLPFAFQIAVGLLLMLGVFVTAAAFGLFTLAASVMLLNFWHMEGTARDSATNSWKCNMAIIGGLLVAAAK